MCRDVTLNRCKMSSGIRGNHERELLIGRNQSHEVKESFLFFLEEGNQGGIGQGRIAKDAKPNQ